jgi:outer membrane lipoprotein SlyB
MHDVHENAGGMTMNTKLIAVVAGCALLSACATPGYQSGYYDRGDARYASAPASESSSGGSYLPQAAGAVVGGLLGAQVGRGNGQVAAAATGAAVGAYAAGRATDPCPSDINMGHVIGGLAGALLGAQVGQGNGRAAAAAVGAATGAVAGGQMVGGGGGGCR